MARSAMRGFVAGGLAAATLIGCGGVRGPELLPSETFTWIRQPIAFCPPPAPWERQGDNGGGLVGVRFILRGGGGQCISLSAFRELAERSRKDAISELIAAGDSLPQREFLQRVSLARARTDDWISEGDAGAARAINAALDRATADYLDGSPAFTRADLDAALRAATEYEPTLEELLPSMRLHPAAMQEPERWRIGRERDTVLAGLPAFASDDTLIAPEQTLLYDEVFWVVKGCAFKATFQGLAPNLATFHRVVDSIRFPSTEHAAKR
jgi:hypothetical protein